MLAVRLHDDGLKVEEMETPSPGPGEVLVRVRAAAITRGELEWPVDRLPAIPSYELSGVVVDSQQRVRRLAADALVMGVERATVGRIRPRESRHLDCTRIALPGKERVEIAVCKRPKGYCHEHGTG